MVQMIGVVILALGLPALFESIDEGEYVDNVVIVAGYVVMRVGLLFQWLRAARSAPEYRAGLHDLRALDLGRADRLDRARDRAHVDPRHARRHRGC